MALNDLQVRAHRVATAQALEDHKLFIATENEIVLDDNEFADLAMTTSGASSASLELSIVSGEYTKIKIDFLEGATFTTGSGTNIPINDRNRVNPVLLPGTLERDPVVTDIGIPLDNGFIAYGQAGFGNNHSLGFSDSTPSVKMDVTKKYIIRIQNLDKEEIEISTLIKGVVGI